MRYNSTNKQQGFTLIEMVIGIVVFSIAMVMITSLILPRAEQSVDPIFQVRAAKLADTLLNEIRGKAYDNNSNLSQGTFRCSEDNGNPDIQNDCTDEANFGDEGEAPEFFNDVDDYDGFTVSQKPLDGSESYEDIYSGYSYVVNVIYDGNYDGVSDSLTNAKLITVTVTTPNGESLDFATYRSNY